METTTKKELIFAPNSINGLKLLKAIDLLFNIDVVYPISGSVFIKYTTGREINVIEASESKDCDDCHQVEMLNSEEIASLRKDLRYYEEDSCWCLNRKELSAICYVIYHVMDIIEAIKQKNFFHFLNNKEVKLIADAHKLTNDKFTQFFTGKFSVPWTIYILAKIRSFELAEHADIINQFIEKVMMVDKIINA